MSSSSSAASSSSSAEPFWYWLDLATKNEPNTAHLPYSESDEFLTITASSVFANILGKNQPGKFYHQSSNYHSGALKEHTYRSEEDVRKMYWGLGFENKWKECIDGHFHVFGKYVFDKGLHNSSCAEPGYLTDMEGGFGFVSDTLNCRITPEWFLKLHSITCGHFQGPKNSTLMGPEKVGVFRDDTDVDLIANYPRNGKYAMTQETKNEFNAADLGKLVDDGENIRINYKVMSRDETRKRFELYTDLFYNEMATVTTPDEKLKAICKYVKYLDWLHPVRDGTGRTIMFGILNKILTENGFHPVLLKNPYLSDCLKLENWTDYVKTGLWEWEKERISNYFFRLTKSGKNIDPSSFWENIKEAIANANPPSNSQ